MDFKVADIVRDANILKEARYAAQELLNDDAHLEKPENSALKRFLSSNKTVSKKQWSRIS